MGRLPLWARLRSHELVVLKVEKGKRHELGVHIGQQSRLEIVSLTYSIPFAVAAATIEVVPLRASRDVFGAPVNAFAGLNIAPEVRQLLRTLSKNGWRKLAGVIDTILVGMGINSLAFRAFPVL